MDEVWREVPGFPNYEVSSEGRVRSKDHLRRCGAGGSYTQRGRVLKAGIAGNGYPLVCLSRDSKSIPRTVHSLVAEAFIGPRPEGQQVRHKDGNRLNAVATNLEYGTPSENVRDCIKHGTHKGFAGGRKIQYRDAESYRRGAVTRRKTMEGRLS